MSKAQTSTKVHWAQSLEDDFDLIGSTLGIKKTSSKTTKHIPDNTSVSSFRQYPSLSNFETLNSPPLKVSYIKNSTPPAKYATQKSSNYSNQTSILTQKNFPTTQEIPHKHMYPYKTSEFSFNSNIGSTTGLRESISSFNHPTIETKHQPKSLKQFLGLTKPAFEVPKDPEPMNLKANLSKSTLDKLNSRMGTFPQTKNAPDDSISIQGRLANPQQDMSVMLRAVQSSPKKFHSNVQISTDSQINFDRYKPSTRIDNSKYSRHNEPPTSLKRQPQDFLRSSQSQYIYEHTPSVTGDEKDKFRIFKNSDTFSDLSIITVGRNLPDKSYHKIHHSPADTYQTSRAETYTSRHFPKTMDFNDKAHEELTKKIAILQNHMSQLQKQLDHANHEIKTKDLTIQRLEKQLELNSDIRQSNEKYSGLHSSDIPKPSHKSKQKFDHEVFVNTHAPSDSLNTPHSLKDSTSTKSYIENTVQPTLPHSQKSFVSQVNKTQSNSPEKIDNTNPNLTRLKALLESAKRRGKVFDGICKNDYSNTGDNDLQHTDDVNKEKMVIFEGDNNTDKSKPDINEVVNSTNSFTPDNQPFFSTQVPLENPWLNNIYTSQEMEDNDPFIDFTAQIIDVPKSHTSNPAQLSPPHGKINQYTPDNLENFDQIVQPVYSNNYSNSASNNDIIKEQNPSQFAPVFPGTFPQENLSKNNCKKHIMNKADKSSENIDTSSLNINTSTYNNDQFNTSINDLGDINHFSSKESPPASPIFPHELAPKSQPKNFFNDESLNDNYTTFPTSESQITELQFNDINTHNNKSISRVVNLKPVEDNHHEDSCGSKSTETSTINVFVEGHNEETIVEESPISNTEETQMSLIFSKTEPKTTNELNENELDIKFFEVNTINSK